jgi:anaerobic magnesium-protoporphyrin IX monomethyl ester cyclase
MKVALINPNWHFERGIYFGCREAHLPIEYGYAQALLAKEGHEVLLIDAQMDKLDTAAIRRAVESFGPDALVVTTAPSYLFWRCAPPELRVPKEVFQALRSVDALKIVIGPHVSTTPRAALNKLGADLGILGEPEEILPRVLATERGRWREIRSICYPRDGQIVIQGGRHQSDMTKLPALAWPTDVVQKHRHHHHRFDEHQPEPAAEIEFSRGCPYHCSFCAKENFRTDYRKRPLHVVLDEMDSLIESGAKYVYFIDEIFLPDKDLLAEMVHRDIQFGIQTRIDLWRPDLLRLLGAAGCVSIEAGIESISPEGRQMLDKNCRLSTDELSDRLIFARKHVPFVQANLIECNVDEEDAIEEWRQHLIQNGVWANKPVPLFPYPGSPDYTRLWGAPDDFAWERAHEFYLHVFSMFSDIQDEQPLPLTELENIA